MITEDASCGLPVVASNIPENQSMRPEKGWILSPVNDYISFETAINKCIIILESTQMQLDTQLTTLDVIFQSRRVQNSIAMYSNNCSVIAIHRVCKIKRIIKQLECRYNPWRQTLQKVFNYAFRPTAVVFSTLNGVWIKP